MVKIHFLKVDNHMKVTITFTMPNIIVGIDQQDLEAEHVYSELVHGRIAVPKWLYLGNYQEPHPNIGMYTQNSVTSIFMALYF